MRNKARVKCTPEAAVQTVFTAGNVAVNAPVLGALAVIAEEETIKIAPVPAYLVYDGFEQDLDAAMVYERLMDCQHDSPTRTHALKFLRSCMIGGWRARDNKPFVSQETFFATVPAQARLWASQRFKDMFSRLLNNVAVVTPPRFAAGAEIQHPQGAAAVPPQPARAGMFQMDAAAVQQLFQNVRTAAGVTPPITVPEDTFKVSDGERHECMPFVVSQIMQGMTDFRNGTETFLKNTSMMSVKHRLLQQLLNETGSSRMQKSHCTQGS